MKPHLKYLVYVLKHKWYVFKAGRVLGGIPLWRLIIHDYSKFSRAEWTPYVHRFFSGRAGVEEKSLDPDEFHNAWRHHFTHNPHHWEYWIVGTKIDHMPVEFVREMVADWLGAGKGISGSWDLTEWYEGAKSRQIFHDVTKSVLDVIMINEVPGVITTLESGGLLDRLGGFRARAGRW